MCRRFALALVLALAAGGGAHAEVVGRGAMARARAVGQATVAVVLKMPGGGASVHRRRSLIGGLRARVLQGMPARDFKVIHAYATVPGFVATVSAAGLAELASSPDVLRVDLDAPGHAALAHSVPQIRADRVHARGIGGAGVVMAILDSGVDASHPDLAGAVVDEECFCAQERCCPGDTARASGPGSAALVNTHGEHVAGIALSRGHVSSVGVAPQAKLVAVRVLDRFATGYLSDWIAALDWIATDRLDVRIVNMSLSGSDLYAGDCVHDCSGDYCAENMLFADVIGHLRERGTLVFAAAGNEADAEALTSPACVEPAIAVGAVDGADRVFSSSNGGPLLDLFAPGVKIVSDGSNGGLSVMSGTSMATPHAAGTAALLLSARPSASADEIEEALRGTGFPVLDPRSGRTTPRVDALAALNAVSENAELARGGGSRASDCMVEWNFIPPSIVRQGRRPLAACTDNDPLCDADTQAGRCTFLLSLCFNIPDPLLPQCAIDEPITSLRLFSPRPGAPAGSVERSNADALRAALPVFPLHASSTCTEAFPLVVARPGASSGLAEVRLGVTSSTRRDNDRFSLVCEAP
jgi:hypothetical protein